MWTCKKDGVVNIGVKKAILLMDLYGPDDEYFNYRIETDRIRTLPGDWLPICEECTGPVEWIEDENE